MKISQREARRLRKRVDELEKVLEDQRDRWSRTYFGGTEIARVSLKDVVQPLTAIRTARVLRHSVVAVVNNDDHDVRFVALPSPEGK